MFVYSIDLSDAQLEEVTLFKSLDAGIAFLLDFFGNGEVETITVDRQADGSARVACDGEVAWVNKVKVIS